jgi:uncharacterized protein (UPF0335 family)
MSLEDIESRIDRLEAEVLELHKDKKEIQNTLHNIDKSLVKLNMVIEGLTQKEKTRSDAINKVYMFVIGSLVAAVMAFIFNGGLS